MLSAFFRDNSFLLQQSQTLRYSYKYSKFLELFIEVTFQETFQSKEIYNNNFLVFSYIWSVYPANFSKYVG